MMHNGLCCCSLEYFVALASLQACSMPQETENSLPTHRVSTCNNSRRSCQAQYPLSTLSSLLIAVPLHTLPAPPYTLPDHIKRRTIILRHRQMHPPPTPAHAPITKRHRLDHDHRGRRIHRQQAA